ncbi:lasso peptide biosynthesis PqqD family chaperone [Parasphingorhabdus sp.]|uniref:lasso peptide biosynthesis PqqD family chaperone n=1 Tax=Parasphingorhabdus sp. TaxID=2709688 RepID=UPI003A8EBF0D
MTTTPMIDDKSRFVRSPDLVASELEGEVVLLSVESSHFYNLNRIGSRIWDLLDQPLSIPEICRELMAQFNVSPTDCESEVRQFIEKMLDQGLFRLA